MMVLLRGTPPVRSRSSQKQLQRSNGIDGNTVCLMEPENVRLAFLNPMMILHYEIHYIR